MSDEIKRTTEIDEVHSFGGGDIKSVEPIAEVHREPSHQYSGGEVVERTSTDHQPDFYGASGVSCSWESSPRSSRPARSPVFICQDVPTRVPIYTNNAGVRRCRAEDETG